MVAVLRLRTKSKIKISEKKRKQTMGFTVNDAIDNGFGGETTGIYVTLSKRVGLQEGTSGGYSLRAVVHYYLSKAVYDATPQKQLGPLETIKQYNITAEELNSGDNVAMLFYAKLKAAEFDGMDLTDDL
jgi:hypothetical protein